MPARMQLHMPARERRAEPIVQFDDAGAVAYCRMANHSTKLKGS
jgi:hypothetical protein